MNTVKLQFLTNCALKQINEHKFIHIILIIIIMSSSIFLGWISNVSRIAVVNTNVVSAFRNPEVYFVEAGGIKSEFTKEDMLEMHKDYLEAQVFENINTGLIMQAICYYKENRVDMYIYQDLLKESVVLDLSEGVQLYEYEGDYIPIILTDNHYLLEEYSIGDVLDITCMYQELEDERSAPFKRETAKFQICGIIKRPYRYFINSLSYSIEAASLMNNDNSEMIISADWITSDGRLASELQHYLNPMSFNFMAEITAEEGTPEYEAAYDFLITNYVVNSYSYFLEWSNANYKHGLADRIYILVCIIGFVSVGIASTNIYIGKKQTKDFAIYFLSGAKWSDCVFIDLFRNLFVIVLPTLISSLACGLYYSQFLKETYTTGGPIDVISVFFVLLFMSVVFAISSLPYIIKLKNTEPITFVRTMNRE